MSIQINVVHILIEPSIGVPNIEYLIRKFHKIFCV